MLNSPAALVVAACTTEVLLWVTVTLVPAMAAPVGSNTVPVIATLPPPCARAQAADKSTTRNANICMRHDPAIPPKNVSCLIRSPSAGSRHARFLHTALLTLGRLRS